MKCCVYDERIRQFHWSSFEVMSTVVQFVVITSQTTCELFSHDIVLVFCPQSRDVHAPFRYHPIRSEIHFGPHQEEFERQDKHRNEKRSMGRMS